MIVLRKVLVFSSLFALYTGVHVSEAMAETIFSDNFAGSTLDPSWQVWPGQGAYSLVGGSLRYYNQGPLSSPRRWSTTSLALALPFTGTSWQLDAKATYNLYWLNSQGNSSGGQGPELMVSFDSTSAYIDYVDFNRGIDAWYNANILSAWYVSPLGQLTVEGLLNPADATITNNIADGEYWYRITRNGGTLTMDYSYDGVNYMTALSTPLANPSSSFNQLLLSATTWETVGSFTDYDYVTISDTVPEPGTYSLLALGLVSLAWVGRKLGRTN